MYSFFLLVPAHPEGYYIDEIGSSCNRITTQAECVTAAKALNLADTTRIPDSTYSNYAQGCFCNAGGKDCAFNKKASGRACGYNGYNCICKSGKLQRNRNAFILHRLYYKSVLNDVKGNGS